MNIHYYQHYIDAWRRDTAHLTLEERGAYRELLDAFYFMGGRLPSNIDQVCRIIGVQTQSERKAIARVLKHFFEEKDGFFSQKRAQKELQKISDRSEKASKSAQAKHKKNNDTPTANAHANAERTEVRTQSEGTCERSAIQYLITNNNKKDIDPPNPPSDEFSEKQEIKLAFEYWNETAGGCGLAKIEKLTDQRRVKLRARLRDCGGIGGWRDAINKIQKSAFLLGYNARGWRADFDFVLQEKSFNKLREGSYSDKDEAAAQNGAGGVSSRILAGIKIDPAILATLRRHPSFTDQAITRWIAPCRIEHDRIVAPSAFHAEWLERNFSSALISVFGQEFKIEVGAQA